MQIGNEEMKRICIFSIYDREGIIDEYVLYYLNSLKQVANRIVIVINGNISSIEKKKLDLITNEVFVRENKGYDAGAYKFALTKAINHNDILEYDELILCNDTCFGPLFSFNEVFDKMERKDYDFWGLNGYFDMIFSHIQSYFLVFSKRVLKEKSLYDYFEHYIDENSKNLNLVYCSFEVGLFDYLTRIRKYSYGCFSGCPNLDVYVYSFSYISNYDFPVIKKKTFEDFDKYGANAWSTLNYVKYNTDYNIDLILDNINRIYGHNILKADIKGDKFPPKEQKIPLPIVSDEELESSIKDRRFYIYGPGMYGYKTYWRYALNNPLFKGFVISDGREMLNKELFGFPIIYYSDLELDEEERVVVGLGPEYTKELMPLIEKDNRFIRIF